MRVTVNGLSHEVTAETLGELLSELDYDEDWLATAVNDAVVPAPERTGRRLADGDRVEILSPMQGG